MQTAIRLGIVIVIMNCALSLYSFKSAYADSAKVTPIIVNLLGFSSCRKDELGNSDSPLGTYMRKRTIELRQDLDRLGLNKSKMFSGCFGYSKSKFVGSLSFRYSSDQKNIASHDFGTFWMQHEVIESELEPIVEIVVQEIDKLITDVDKPKIFILSHSWGAWLGMKLTLKMAERSVKMGGLVTIDPVSPFKCYPKKFFDGRGKAHPDCRKRPQDFDEATQDAIKENVGFWQHYYQRRMYHIQSGPIERLVEGVSSVEVTFNRGFLPRNYHAELTKLPQLWSFVKQMIPQSLKVNQSGL